jgi:hypothetical protein
VKIKTLSPEQAIRLGHRHRLRVANYMFGAEPKHPFWLDVLQEMLCQAERKIVSENDILESTGPGLWTNVYHRVKTNILIFYSSRTTTSHAADSAQSRVSSALLQAIFMSELGVGKAIAVPSIAYGSCTRWLSHRPSACLVETEQCQP